MRHDDRAGRHPLAGNACPYGDAGHLQGDA
jgi:hypothetical protein